MTLNFESDIIKVQEYANGLRKEVATWHQLKKEETVTESRYPAVTRLTEHR